MTPTLRVHLLSASREYRSDATLTVLRAVLAERGIDNMPIPAFDPHDEWFDADGEDG